MLTEAIAIIALIAFVSHLSSRNKTNLPRVGRPGPFGYAWTVIRSVLDSNGLVDEGCKQFGGKPFIFPTMSGQVVVLGPENVELIRKSDDSVFNAPLNAEKLFQVKVMFGDIVSNPYHLETILRSDLTKALTSLVPEVLEETQLALPDILQTKDLPSSTVPLFDTMVHLVARVSNRAMIGAPGCRDKIFLRRQVSLAEQVIPMSQFLNWFPQFMKPLVYKSLSLILGSKTEAVHLVKPYIESRIQYAQQDNPQTITDLLIKYAPEDEITHPEKLAVRVVHLNIASIHTTGIFLTHSLFELASLSPEQIQEIRSEVEAAIEAEGGVCNKAAVGKFYKLDSLLKEIGRFHPLFAVGSSRLTLRDAVIADGTVIPQGSVVAIPPRVMHHNPDTYDDPEVFDPFRFSKLRKSSPGISDAKQSFTTLSNDYVLFGVGKHACPGRFFAALEIKVILAEILLNYNLSFPPGTPHKPKLFSFNLFTVPSPTAKLTFTCRT